MCVIAIVSKIRPSERMVEKMWEKNPEGGGVAWREGGKVKWRKSLDLGEMKEACVELPLPYVAHFRIASTGGVKDELTHPFAVDDFEKSLDLQGETDGRVLFHNGTWTDWKRVLFETAAGWGRPIPEGRWNDTRAMAWVTSLFGKAFLDILDEKAVLFSPTDTPIILGHGWRQVDGIWCSNDLFQNNHYYSSGGSGYKPMCRAATCTEVDRLDAKGYCPKHPPTKEAEKSPLALGLRWQEAEAEEAKIKRGELRQDQRKTSKNELKRLRKEMSKLPPDIIATFAAAGITTNLLRATSNGSAH